MKIICNMSDPVTIYHDGRRLGSVSYEVFCLKVLSPRTFRKLERDPDLREFEVRRIDLDQALAGYGVPPEYAW